MQECAHVQIERDKRERCRVGERKGDCQQGKRPEGSKRGLRGGCEMSNEGRQTSMDSGIKRFAIHHKLAGLGRQGLFFQEEASRLRKAPRYIKTTLENQGLKISHKNTGPNGSS